MGKKKVASSKSTRNREKKAEPQVLPGLYPPELDAVRLSLEPKYTFFGEKGRGKTGITYELKSAINSHHSYCMKTILPSIRGKKERERVRTTLTKEVEILLPLNHRCLPRIYEHELDGATPYYICTCHPGITLTHA